MKLDDAERHARGELPDDPESGTVPMNEAARKRAEAEPRILTVKQVMSAAADQAMSPRPRGVCTTGAYKLDEITGGIVPGHVWVFGADTSWGKSSWLVMLADENIRAGRKVLIVSSEDDESLYGARLLARRARVRADRLRMRRLDRDDMRLITEQVAKAEDLPVYLDARGRKAEWVAEKSEALIREHGIELVAYDYLQEFRSGSKQQDRRNEVSEVASLLRMVPKRCGIAGIIFSQITVTDPDKPPTKHSIRESRDVSNGAEAVLLGFTPTADVKRKVNNVEETLMVAGKRYVFADKIKNGPRGKFVEMDWDDDCACFNAIRDPELERYEQIATDDIGLEDH